MKQWSIALIPLVILSLLASIYGCNEFNSFRKGIAGVKPLYRKDADSFFKEFERSEERANRLYSGKVVSVKGKIIQFTEADSVQTVLLGEESSVNGVMCQLEPGQKRTAEEMKPGLVVQIKGVCTGLCMDVVLVQCVRE